ncbi:uncharacterized protein F4817DRAFT_18483 [Daldinia loculata]|uniref:uncharacterized protein n=1 Tax=Daldinia loculata TaxID=103429 RepID=UPI0020C5054E|nr:uncharacterized protein F4817DRAFT_18483 [Daldinia loculata]KAI1642048.1 hypothetical protein F4817DRAFT_18483 [Daldinia loculata]
MPGSYKMESNVEGHTGLPDKPFKESDLLRALESIHKKASFASMTRINTFHPDIFVQGVGMIDNPLSETQAKQIAAKSHQAPHEKSNETIVDTPVPNIWELNPDQFEIRAPVWQAYLNKTLVYVAKKLVITSPISAELHKMLLYEQGAMSKTPPDTEEIPGMFGTLVINLPSHHEGGDVVVKYRGASKILPTSQHDMACAFWFSDASYEVLPVKSGYNWVLVYKLAVDPTAAVPTAASRLEDKALRTVLESWSREVSNGSRKPLPLCYAFDDNYTDEGGRVSYQGLKDADRERVRCLRTMCTDLDFDVFLATLEKQETRIIEDKRCPDWDMGCHCDHDDEEEEGQDDVDYDTADGFCDVSYKLTEVVDVEGTMLASNLRLDEECILQESSFTGMPWDEEYEGYVGLAGPQQTSRYLTSALVIVPCEGTVPFIISHEFELTNLLRIMFFRDFCGFLIDQCTNSSSKAARLNQLYELFNTNVKPSYFKEKISPDHFLKALQLSIQNENHGLLRLIMTEYKQPPPIEFFAWLGQEYDKSAVSSDNFEKMFLYAFNLQPTIHRRWTALCDVNVDLEEIEKLRNLASRTVNECLEACRRTQLQEEDGKALFSLSFYCLGFEYLKTVVVPVLEDCSSLTAFIIGFLQSFDLRYSQIPKDDIRAVYERIALAAINKLELNSLTAAEIPSDIRVNGSRSTSGPQYVTYKSSLRFISTLIELKLQKHLTLLAQKIVAQASRVKGEELDTFWIPLLHGLFIVFEKRRVLLSVPYWMQIYQSFFKAYVMNYVLEQPAPPCSCHDCTWSLTAQFNAAMDLWWTRRLHAEFLLETFDQEMLRTVLGDQYDDIMSMKMLKRQQSQPVVCSTKQAYLQQIQLMHATSRARNTNSSLTMSNLYNMPPRPPVTLSTAVAAGPARPAPRPTPKRSMLEVSRSISESARKRAAQNISSPSTRRNHGASSPVGGGSSSTPSRPTQTIPNPIAGAKRKYIDVIDLTGDD